MKTHDSLETREREGIWLAHRSTHARWIAALLILIIPVIGQSAPTSLRAKAGEADGHHPIARPTLYTLFLTDRAASLGSGDGTASDRAAALHVTVADIHLIDKTAADFAAKDRSLRSEALRYLRNMQKRHQPQDPRVVRSFTERRAALAVASFAVLRSELAPANYTALQRYLDSDFSKSISSVR
ncbi:MAG TPA: hypothetical protein VFW83_03330 [Bryobacteraceae bacterium]|nr:hypothetical protein [Bryobacteraceae bacterium]